jgi:hypothetical protein
LASGGPIKGGTMHTRYVFWLDADPGAWVMLLIGVSAVSFLAFSGL